MRHFIWKLFVVTAMALSLGAVPAMSADDEDEWAVASGVAEEAYRDISTIVIADEDSGDSVTVCCFPFGFLERELEEALDLYEEDLYIEAGDCVTVKYALLHSKNVAVALTYYCDDCGVEGCYEDDEGILLRDDDLLPVPKGEMAEEEHKNKKGKGKKDKKDKENE